MAFSKLWGENGLVRYPQGPVSLANSATASLLSPVRKISGIFWSWCMLRAASMPSIFPARWMSIRMRSGLVRAASLTASSPEDTSSVCSHPAEYRTRRMASTISASSSTISIRASFIIRTVGIQLKIGSRICGEVTLIAMVICAPVGA
jgi:hypothetical protein